MRRFTIPAPLSRQYRTFLNGLLLFIMGSSILWLVATSRFTTWDLRNNLWGPAYLLLRQQNPYDLSPLFELGNAVWMPMSLGFFFPIGLLTEQQSSMLWLILNIGIALLIVLIAGGTVRPRLLPFVFCVLALFLYPPMISHLRAGQYTLLAVLLMLASVYLVTKSQYGLATLLLALALAKPQLGILVAPGLLFHIFLRDGFKKAVWFCVLLLFWIILLTLPLFIFYPAWPSGLLTALQNNPTWVHPSLFSLFQLWFKQFGLWLWLPLFIILFAVNLRIWQKMAPQTAVYWSLALTGCATPYVWSYDFVLQLPLFVHAVFSLQHRLSQIVLWLGFLFTWGFIYWTATHTNADNFRYWFVPWCLLLTIGAAYIVEKRRFTHGSE